MHMEKDKKIDEIISDIPKSTVTGRNLTTLISKKVYDQLLLEPPKLKILAVGEKYFSEYHQTNFDVFDRLDEVTKMGELIKDGFAVMPVFDRSEIANPQQCFLDLNKDFPEIQKTMLRYPEEEIILRFFRMIVRESNNHIFIPGSFKVCL